MAHSDSNASTHDKLTSDFPAVNVESVDSKAAHWCSVGDPGLPKGQFIPGNFAKPKSNFHHTDPNPPGIPEVQ